MPLYIAFVRVRIVAYISLTPYCCIHHIDIIMLHLSQGIAHASLYCFRPCPYCCLHHINTIMLHTSQGIAYAFFILLSSVSVLLHTSH